MKLERNEAVAGSFYPKDPKKLNDAIRQFLSKTSVQASRPIKVIIVPHAGYAYSGQTAADSFIETTLKSYKRIILLGPSHYYPFNGIVSSDVQFWNNPTGQLAVEKSTSEVILPGYRYHEQEHSLEVQIPFIKHLIPNVPILPLLVSGDQRKAPQFAKHLASLDDKDTLWVISSDFTHYGPRFNYEPSIPEYGNGADFDRKAIELIQKNDHSGFTHFLQETRATICGALPILIAMNLLDQWDIAPFTMKKYTSSAEISGDYIDTVGYTAMYS